MDRTYGAGVALRTAILRQRVEFCGRGAVFRRSPVRMEGDWAGVAKALGSIVLCGTLFRLSQPLWEWPLHSQVVMALGTGVATVALVYLGRSFAVLPSVREVKVNGPYRLVRHPVYLGELTMVLACVLAVPTVLTLGLFAATLVFAAIRVRAEENLLLRDAAYRAYRERVRFRLAPGLW